MNDDRNILVRIVVGNDSTSRDRIIRATNSQTSIPPASLRATDEIHRNIEYHLATVGLYYDRRKNFYKNAGSPKDKIISISYLAQAIMAIVLKRPDDSRARPSSLLKRDEDYQQIFNKDYPIELFLYCTRVLRRVEEFLRTEVTGLTSNDRNNFKFHLAMYAVYRQATRSVLRPDDLVKLSMGDLTNELLHTSYKDVSKIFAEIHSKENLSYDQIAKGKDAVNQLTTKLSTM